MIRAHALCARDVSVDDEGAFRDVDTMDEYQQLIAESGAGGLPDVLRQVGSDCRPPHFGERVTIGDEPCADARRYVAHLAGAEDVESDAVEFSFFRSCNNPDSHEHHEVDTRFLCVATLHSLSKCGTDPASEVC